MFLAIIQWEPDSDEFDCIFLNNCMARKNLVGLIQPKLDCFSCSLAAAPDPASVQIMELQLKQST